MAVHWPLEAALAQPKRCLSPQISIKAHPGGVPNPPPLPWARHFSPGPESRRSLCFHLKHIRTYGRLLCELDFLPQPPSAFSLQRQPRMNVQPITRRITGLSPRAPPILANLSRNRRQLGHASELVSPSLPSIHHSPPESHRIRPVRRRLPPVLTLSLRSRTALYTASAASRLRPLRARMHLIPSPVSQ